jgi:hypothetical protein
MSDLKEYLIHLQGLSEELQRSGYYETLPYKIEETGTFEDGQTSGQQPQQDISLEPLDSVSQPLFDSSSGEDVKVETGDETDEFYKEVEQCKEAIKKLRIKRQCASEVPTCQAII